MRTPNFLLLLAAVASAPPLLAQNLGEIRGRVFGPDGEPLPMANVYTTLNEDLFGTTTDFDGRFVLKPLDPGRYAVTVSYSSYQAVEFPGVAVTADRAAYIPDVRMKPKELEGAEIIHYRRKQIEIDDPSRMSLLAEDIAKLPTVKDPIKFMGSQFAGVTPTPNGDGLYFRGSRTENMVSFIDGIKVSGSVPRVPPSAISSVSVYTGGLPARYGDVTGGVIVIETKTYAEMLQHARMQEAERYEEPEAAD
ncbi:MAG: carboxypeptidase regulatory-like domain-containing protein [Flavobacteriales bacterium]|nr:carboxypeptidase regulatory-like domain-containing protein [Flavobacteriales bacterium]